MVVCTLQVAALYFPCFAAGSQAKAAKVTHMGNKNLQFINVCRATSL